jgi:hypothetical protein
MAAAAYLIGRHHRKLSPDISPDPDSLFASQRLDGTTIEGKVFRHCTFANISFKDCVIKGVNFIDCVFVECYFRNAKIQDCSISASRFIDCNLAKVDFRGTDVRYYNSFFGCFIPYNEIEQCLPSEGNLRAHLCANLATEARVAGEPAESEKFRQAAAAGMEQHLWAAFRHTSNFHREKYQGYARFQAFLDWAASRIRGFAWGYRRSHMVILRNWVGVTLIIFPILYWILRAGVTRNGRPITAPEAVLASAGNMLPGSEISDVRFTTGTTQAVAFAEVLLGLMFLGLVVTLLFRALFERRQ